MRLTIYTCLTLCSVLAQASRGRWAPPGVPRYPVPSGTYTERAQPSVVAPQEDNESVWDSYEESFASADEEYLTYMSSEDTEASTGDDSMVMTMPHTSMVDSEDVEDGAVPVQAVYEDLPIVPVASPVQSPGENEVRSEVTPVEIEDLEDGVVPTQNSDDLPVVPVATIVSEQTATVEDSGEEQITEIDEMEALAALIRELISSHNYNYRDEHAVTEGDDSRVTVLEDEVDEPRITVLEDEVEAAESESENQLDSLINELIELNIQEAIIEARKMVLERFIDLHLRD